MFHLCATLRSSDATVNLDQTPVSDNIMLIQNSHFVPQQDMLLLFAYHEGVTQLRARITSPTIRQYTPTFIRPINAALLPATLTRPMNLIRSPLRLKALEEFAIESTNSAAGPNVATTLLGLSPGPVTPAPQGDIYTMRGTGTTTVTAQAWSQCAITWADTLPAGRYAVVGLNAFGTTCQAARLIFNEQPWRPGCVGGANDTIIQDEMFRNGNLGVWGMFNAWAMPNVEFLCNAADTAQTVYMDCMRVG
jgi:hypothetical protein